MDRRAGDNLSDGVKTQSASAATKFEQSDEPRSIAVNEVAYQIYTQSKLCGVLTELCNEYGEVELLEKYGSYMKIRVSTQGRSLGTLFGLVESIKNKHGVSDYSVSQTTLEQIFQSFANLKFDENIQRYTIDAASGELVKLERDNQALVDGDGAALGISLSDRESEDPNGPKMSEIIGDNPMQTFPAEREF